MKTGAFQEGCRNIACQIAEKRMFSRGWKGDIPKEIIDIFEDMLIGLFEKYFLQKGTYESLLVKQTNIRKIAAGLDVDFRILPAEAHIAAAIARKYEGLLWIEFCLRRMTGPNLGYFIGQVKMSNDQIKEMDGRIKEEVRMALGNKLDDLLSA